MLTCGAGRADAELQEQANTVNHAFLNIVFVGGLGLYVALIVLAQWTHEDISPGCSLFTHLAQTKSPGRLGRGSLLATAIKASYTF